MEQQRLAGLVMVPLGRLVATPGALDALCRAGQSPADFVVRHQFGDWGERSPNDSQANQRALDDDERLLSAYTTAAGERLWIITEADRSATTLLLPEEY
jgi:hypothetical protein